MTGQITLAGGGTGAEAATVDQVDAVQTNLDTHESDIGNPHAVTADQVLALALDGGTMTGQIELPGGGSGLEAATVDEVDAGGSTLAAHIADNANPHAVTAAQVSAVDLADKATQTQAQDGVDDDTWMTPLSTSEAIAAQVHEPAAAQLTTSGTTKDFLDISATDSRKTVSIKVMLKGVIASGGDRFGIRLGTAAGFVSTDVYDSRASAAGSQIVSIDKFVLNETNNVAMSGMIEFNKIDGNTWIMSGTLAADGIGGQAVDVSAGAVELPGELDRLQLIMDGSDTFNGGLVNILVS